MGTPRSLPLCSRPDLNAILASGEEPEPARLKIGFNLKPKFIGILVTDEFAEYLSGISPIFVACLGKAVLEFFERPIGHGVGCVVEHLAHDLASDPRVSTPFDLDESRDRVLVQE